MGPIVGLYNSMTGQIIWFLNLDYTLNRNLNLSFFICKMRLRDNLGSVFTHVVCFSQLAFDYPQASRLFLSLVLLSSASCLLVFHCLLTLSSEAIRKLRSCKISTVRVVRQLDYVVTREKKNAF